MVRAYCPFRFHFSFFTSSGSASSADTGDLFRCKGYVIQAKDKTSAKAAQSIIKNAPKDSIDRYIKTRLNNDSIQFVKVQHGLWEQGKNAAVDKYGLKIKDAEFTPSEQLPIVVCLGKKLKAPEVWSDLRTGPPR